MERFPLTRLHPLRISVSSVLALLLASSCLTLALPARQAHAAQGTPTWTLIGTHAVFYGQNDERYSEKQYSEGRTGYHYDYNGHYSYDESFTWSTPPASIAVGKESEVALSGLAERTNVYCEDESAAYDYQNTHSSSDYRIDMNLYCYDGSKSTSGSEAKDYFSYAYPSHENDSANAIVNKATGTTTFPSLYGIDSTSPRYTFSGATSSAKKISLDAENENISYTAQFNSNDEDFTGYMASIRDGKAVGMSYDSGKTSYLLVIEVRHGSLFRMAYIYQYNPDASSVAVTTNTTASSTAGEDQGGGIPLGAVVGVALVVVVGGVLVAKSRGKKNGEGPEKPDPSPAGKQGTQDAQEDTQKGQPSTFRMIVWKDFGDTLYVGAQPQKVGARIEEVSADGKKTDRPDLTALISIRGSENISVGSAAMDGRYSSAMAQAVERAGEAQYDGVISFTYSGAGGTLTNNVTFHISNRQLMFGEENLTFIAGEGQTIAMPFGIPGMSAADNPQLQFQASITTLNAPFKDAHVEPDKDYPSLWNVVITEDGTQSTLPAGSMEEFSCQVSVTLPGSAKPLTGSFAFYRFTEGLRISVQHLKAYYTVSEAACSQEDAEGIAVKAAFAALGAASGMGTTGLGGIATAQVVGLGMGLNGLEAENAVMPADPQNPKVNIGRALATVALYTWDEETGEVINPLPPVDTKVEAGKAPEAGAVAFAFEDIPGSCNLKDKDGKDVQRPCEALRFFAFPCKLETEPNQAVFSIVPLAGMMTPPNRSQAKVTVTCTYNGRAFSAEQTVNVLSQPYRLDYEERRAEYEAADAHILDRLLHIQKKIITSEACVERSVDGERMVVRDTYGSMMPVYHRIDAMLEGYSPEFGYYEPDIQRIEELFQAYTTGELGSTAAAECAFYGRTIEDSDALIMTVSDFNHSWWTIGARIGFAVFTKGASEGLFMAIQAEMAGYEATLRSIDANTGKSMLAHFRVGVTTAAHTAAVDYLMGKAIEGGVSVASKCAKVLSASAKTAREALAQRLAKGFSTAGEGAKVSGAGKAVAGQMDDAAHAAQELIGRYRGGAEGSAESIQRDIAYNLGRIEGKVKVGVFTNALKEWDSLSLYQRRGIVMAIQQDKHAMRAFMEMEGEAAMRARAQFNAIMGEMEGKGLQMARVSLAEEMGIPLDRIRVKKTSGNVADDVLSGKKLPMDMDATFEVLENGNWVDVREGIGQIHFDRAMYKVAHGYEAADDVAAAAFSKASDFSIVDAKGLESYGTYQDALRVIQKSRAAEAFDNAVQVGKTAEYKCEHWLALSRNALGDARTAYAECEALYAAAKTEADQALAAQAMRKAQALFSASEAFAEEGSRQFIKQYDRIVVNKLGVLKKLGANVDLGSFEKSAEVIRQMGVEKNAGAGLTTAECDAVLKDGLGTNLDAVFHELNVQTVELDKMLQQYAK